MANSNDIVRNSFSKALIEYKVFSDKLILKSVFLYLPCILDDSTIKLEYILEPLMPHPRARFFTTYSSCAIHQKILVFVLFHQVFHQLEFLAKGIYIGTYRVLQMSYLAFVMISHIYYYRVLIIGEIVELLCVNVLTSSRNV